MAHLSPEQMLALLTEGRSRAVVDREYVHKKSEAVYVVADVIFKEDDMSLLVTYYSPYQAEVTFARPIDDFLEKFE